MKKSCIALTALLLADGISGMDGVEYLKENPWVESVSVTSTNVIVKYRSTRMNEIWEDGPTPTSRRKVSFQKESYVAELVLTPDQRIKTQIEGHRHAPIVTFTPVSFKDQHKGFRVTWTHTDGFAPPVITYIALSDTPVALGEGDVETVMGDGEWVRAGDSKSLEIEKLGWRAENLIWGADEIMSNPEELALFRSRPQSVEYWNMLVDKGLLKHPKLEALREEDRVVDPYTKKRLARDWALGEIDSRMMAVILANPDSARAWRALVAEGAIRTNAEPRPVTEDGGAGPSPSRLWLYTLIPLALLAALYFARREKAP
jgi:hypothetical protein